MQRDYINRNFVEGHNEIILLAVRMNYAMNEISTVWNRKDEPARISGAADFFRLPHRDSYQGQRTLFLLKCLIAFINNFHSY